VPFSDRDLRDAREALRAFCWRNDIAAASHVAARFADRFALTARVASHALEAACQNGHLAIVTWLVDRFALTAGDMRGTKNRA
jgi:hypothetical protein